LGLLLEALQREETLLALALRREEDSIDRSLAVSTNLVDITSKWRAARRPSWRTDTIAATIEATSASSSSSKNSFTGRRPDSVV
jgi:hypothetical protein